jgi:di/tricarboxylate transporter
MSPSFSRINIRSFSWQRLKAKTSKRGVISILIALGCLGAIALSAPDLFLSISTSLTWQGWLTVGVAASVFLTSALTSLRPEMVFLGGLAILFVSNVLSPEQALAGFSNPGMITVGVLYIVVMGIQQTGGLVWISQNILGRPKGQNRAMFRLITSVMGLSAFLNNTPVVAMFVPVVSDWSRKLGISPSKLMIPLSYGAIFGGICTLIGTSTNLVVNGLLISQTDYPGLNLLSMTWVSLPCALAGILYLLITHHWLLPDRVPAISQAEDIRQYTVEMVVEANSPLAGKSIEAAGLRHLPGLFLIEIVRGEQIFPAASPKQVLQEQDQLVFVGIVDSIVDLHRLRGLKPATNQVFKLNVPHSDRRLIEAVVSDTCPLVGKTIREGNFRTHYNAVVLAVARNGERVRGKIGEIRLRVGDVLLLEAHHSFQDQWRGARDFYLISPIPDSEPLRHDKAGVAIAILVGMILLAALGWMSMLKAAILASIAMVVTQCCSFNRALRNIEWSILLVIGAALGIGNALEVTGAASTIAATVISFSGRNPWVALALVYGITAILTEMITNNAAVALVFPIALALSKDLDVSFMPFVIAIMIAGSASFATPIGYQTNLMVYSPGGYKFSDFMRVGLPLGVLFWLITVTLTPLVYPF